ncbi:MAG: hypothetical protein KAQ96_14305, partial [Thermoplasmata archaeon]|nr:hypothetical protein [Thermoplasmata archaeon]
YLVDADDDGNYESEQTSLVDERLTDSDDDGTLDHYYSHKKGSIITDADDDGVPEYTNIWDILLSW